jgi:arylsulfatase A-like enzyme
MLPILLKLGEIHFSHISICLLSNLQRAEEIIRTHDPTKPLFLYLPFQNVHDPLQAPTEYIEKYSFIVDKKRRVHAAKVDYTDKAIGNITRTLKDTG